MMFPDLAMNIQQGDKVYIPNFYRGICMGAESYFALQVKRNKKSVSILTTENEWLRIPLTNCVRIEKDK
jgi:hypothetical protein